MCCTKKDVEQRQSVERGSCLRGGVVISSLLSLALLVGCWGSGHRTAQVPEQEQEEAVAPQQAPKVDSVATSAIPGELLGAWIVAGSACPAICGMSGEEANSWIGFAVVLAASEVVFGESTCSDVAYESQQVSAEDFYRYSRFDLTELGISKEGVQELAILCKDQEWNTPALYILVKDRDTLILSKEGVYFFMKRAPTKAE